MTQSPAAPLRFRTLLLAVVVAAAVAILFLAPPRPAAAAAEVCRPIYNTLYYSDASHTTLVGECYGTCNGANCSGEKTSYFVIVQSGCCPL